MLRWQGVNARAVFRKELQVLTRSPLIYILGAVFLGLSGYFFYTDVLYFDILNQDKVGLTQGLWQRFFQDLRFCLILVIPVLTMKLFAEEKRVGTMELLLTYPLRDSEIVGGKLLSLLSVFTFLLVLTGLYPLVLATVWPMEWSPLVAIYVGTYLLGVAFLSCGMFFSAIARTQTSAVLGTFGFLVLFWFLTWNEAAGSPALLAVMRRLSLFDRFYDFTRGTMNSKDLVYFVLFSFLFVFLTLKALRSRWWQGREWLTQSVQIVLIVGICFAAEDLFHRHNVVWDPIQEPESQLSQETVSVLTSLRQDVALTIFYESGRYREVKYLAEKYARQSPRIRVELVDLDRNPNKAWEYGVRDYGVVVVESQGQRVIVHRSFEESIVRAIARVTEGRKQTYFLIGHRENEMGVADFGLGDGFSQASVVVDKLGYEWKELLLQGQPVPEDCAILVVSGPKEDLREEELEEIGRFLDRGGSALFLLDPFPFPRLSAFLSRYRVSVGTEAETAGPSRLYLRDPLTVVASVVARNLVTRDFRWPVILYTARHVGLDHYFSDDIRGTELLTYRAKEQVLAPVGVAVEINGAEGRGRMVVIGDSDFMTNLLLQRRGNQNLLINVLDWLGEKREVTGGGGEEQARYAYAPLTVGQARLLFRSAMVPPVLFLLGGLVTFYRRWKAG